MQGGDLNVLAEMLDHGETGYLDEKERKLAKVMLGLGTDAWKGRRKSLDYKGSSYSGWKCMRDLPWEKTSAEARRDLEELAEKKGWTRVRRTMDEGVHGVVIG